jgi:hypothetical protein
VPDWQWQAQLNHDPIAPLLSSRDAALVYYARGDLIGEDAGPVERLWELPGAQKILKKQLEDGSWPRGGEHKHPAVKYGLIETWRWFRYLVAQYGFTRQHPAVRQVAEFLFSCQTEEGDFRGILANQYATYYSGAILGLLIQAGYAADPRVEKCFQWLLSMRQSDGGWSIPMITHKLDRETQYRLSSEYAEPLQPERSKPFSHNATGMILRAFAAHPQYRNSEAARTAAGLLAGRFFQPDAYTSYHDASYWLRFEYPFWWNNLVAALDSLSRIGLSQEDEQIRQALDWLREHQEASGLWKVSYARPDEVEKDTEKVQTMKLWVSLAICRVFCRFYAQARVVRTDHERWQVAEP